MGLSGERMRKRDSYWAHLDSLTRSPISAASLLVNSIISGMSLTGPNRWMSSMYVGVKQLGKRCRMARRMGCSATQKNNGPSGSPWRTPVALSQSKEPSRV